MTEGISNSASVTGGDAKVDVQDPLPETNWLWRRSYTFALSLISLAFVWFGAEAMYSLNRPLELFKITEYMIWILGFLILCYMVAPSAEQIVKLVQVAGIIKAGVPVTHTAVAETPDGRSEVTTTAGGVTATGGSSEPAYAPAREDAVEEEMDYAPRSRTQ